MELVFKTIKTRVLSSAIDAVSSGESKLGVTFQKMEILTTTAVITSNLTIKTRC
jgi:hypothetical protein